MPAGLGTQDTAAGRSSGGGVVYLGPAALRFLLAHPEIVEARDDLLETESRSLSQRGRRGRLRRQRVRVREKAKAEHARQAAQPGTQAGRTRPGRALTPARTLPASGGPILREGDARAPPPNHE